MPKTVTQKLVLDTDVVVAFLAGNKRVVEKVRTVGSQNLYLCPVSIGEIYADIVLLAEGSSILDRIDYFLSVLNVLPFSLNVARLFGKMKAAPQLRQSIIDRDIWLSSFAIVHCAAVATGRADVYDKIRKTGFTELRIEEWLDSMPSPVSSTIRDAARDIAIWIGAAAGAGASGKLVSDLIDKVKEEHGEEGYEEEVKRQIYRELRRVRKSPNVSNDDLRRSADKIISLFGTRDR